MQLTLKLFYSESELRMKIELIYKRINQIEMIEDVISITDKNDHYLLHIARTICDTQIVFKEVAKIQIVE